MIRKVARDLTDKAKVRLTRDIAKQLDTLRDQVNESIRLMNELIIEERKRESKHLSGGMYRTSDREIATKIFDDSIMFLDPNDIAVAPHILLEGIWERPVTTAWIDNLTRRDLVVFDIGANFGYFGMLAAARLDRKKSKVVMFEANPNLLPYIDKTLSVNWLHENTVVEGLAVSDRKGHVELNILADYIGSSSVHSVSELDKYLSHKMQIKAQEVISVPTISIDEYCKSNGIKRIDRMKMDIEGYEDVAYAGMRNIVKASDDMMLYIEFTKDGYKDPKKFYNQMLQDFGNVNLIDPQGKLVNPENTDYDSVMGSVSDWVMLVFSKHNHSNSN
jgi:FkbM family methyltransferase